MENMEGLKGRNILVTGGTGFVGSHVVELLLKRKANVIVPYRSTDPRSYFFTQKLDKRTILAQCDLKNIQRVRDIVIKYEIEYIIHLAAQPIVTTAYNNPSETLESNIMGTVNILESARGNSRIRCIIVASSDKAYGKTKKEYTESDPLRGDHPYDVSKSAADLISSAYFKTYNTPVVITRFGNIYGPGDLNNSRIIPDIMQSILLEKKLELRSDGSFIRDYIYVKDVADAYVFLLTKAQTIIGESFNIASGVNFSVVDLIKKVRRILQKPIRYSIINSAVNEIPYQHLCCSKITKLGWESHWSLNKSIKQTYVWYKKQIRK